MPSKYLNILPYVGSNMHPKIDGIQSIHIINHHLYQSQPCMKILHTTAHIMCHKRDLSSFHIPIHQTEYCSRHSKQSQESNTTTVCPSCHQPASGTLKIQLCLCILQNLVCFYCTKIAMCEKSCLQVTIDHQ